MTIDELRELLGTVTDESSLEEARRVIADALENIQSINDDIETLRVSYNDATAEIGNLTDEVNRLKEENGRLFRDRRSAYVNEVADDIQEDIEDAIAKLEQNINV